MNDEPLDKLEQQLALLQTLGAPPALRGAVLADVRRELRASRWDRRLARTAAVLLITGIGLNAALVGSKNAGRSRSNQFAHQASRKSLVEAAVAVAQATSAETGGQFVRHLAALSGRTLTSDDLAAIDTAIEQQSHHASLNGEG